MSLKLKADQWYYDTSGYYYYLMLNTSDREYQELVPQLKRRGLVVLKEGRSFRPAGNGRQYQYYLRVAAMSPERIEEILTPFADVPRGPRELAAEAQKAHEVQLHHMQDLLESREQELQETRAKLVHVIQELRKSHLEIGQLRSIEMQFSQLKEVYNSALQALRNSREEKEQLRSAWAEIQRSADSIQKATPRLQAYEETVTRLQKELSDKEAELQRWIATFDPDLKKRDEEIQSLWGQLAALERERAELVDAVEELRAKAEQRETPSTASHLRSLVQLFLPNIAFVGGSLDMIWHELEDLEPVLRDVVQLGEPDFRGERVECAPDWKKRNIGKVRLYWRKCVTNGMFQVLVGEKKTQKADIQWLARQV
jgi:hypothetical protein